MGINHFGNLIIQIYFIIAYLCEFWIIYFFCFSHIDWRWLTLKKKLIVSFVRWDQVHDDSKKKKSLPIISRRLATDVDLQLDEKVRDTGLSLQQAQIWEMPASQRLWVKLRQCWHRVLRYALQICWIKYSPNHRR